MTTFIALAAVILGSTGLVAGPAALSAAAAGPVLAPVPVPLVDLYIRQPGLASYDYSTAAATYPSRNYTIAPADAWSQSIEVDGFGRAQRQTALGASAVTGLNRMPRGSQ
jgi:hypothetical protein